MADSEKRVKLSSYADPIPEGYGRMEVGFGIIIDFPLTEPLRLAYIRRTQNGGLRKRVYYGHARPIGFVITGAETFYRQ